MRAPVTLGPPDTATGARDVSEPLRVLFVEDSESDLELVVRALRRGGFDPSWEVVDAAPAMEAALQRGPWDVIVADHSMPRFNAPDALGVLKRSGLDLPFIVVSGHIGEELAVACMKAGAHDYINKDNLARLAPAVPRELREAGDRRRRREAESALDEAQERYRVLVDNAADVIGVLDTAGRMQFVSPSVRRTLGWEPDELAGRPVLEFVHPDDVEPVRAHLGEAMAEGSLSPLERIRVRHRDGSWRIFEGSGAHVAAFGGTPQLIVTARDITDRVQLEEQLNQAQKMEAIGQLAGGVAHDFNNLLTVILGYSSRLLDQLARQPELHAEVDEIRRAATRAANLTQQLLAFSRKQVFALQVVDLGRVVEGVDKLIRRLIGADVQLTLKLDPAECLVRVDPGQMEQVIMNLVVNARDAMPQGGRLTLQTACVDLDRRDASRTVGVQPGPHVMLAVSDSGEGMDEATQARLFEPFFTTKAPGKGTGLGLSTVYGIVRQSGGAIRVQSAPGRGATFRIYLPRVEARVSAAVEAPPAPAPATLRGGETILLAEDEPQVRGMVRELLRRHGYSVIEARDGPEALDLARRHRGLIHLLLSDVVMPGMNGIEVATRLAEERPEMRALYVSGYTEDVTVHREGFQPGTAFLAKPFTDDALLRAVREVLDAPVPAAEGATAGERPPAG